MTKRRVGIGALVVALAGVVAAVAFFGGNRRPAGPPDLVLVLVDTLRADHVGAYGHGRDTSPEIDALAERGLVFERAFAHSGWTLPSAASLLTGLYPSEHGATRDPFRPGAFGSLRADVTTLAESLGKRGYRTGAFVNNVFLAPRFGLRRDFDVYDYRGATNAEHRSAPATVRAALRWLEADEMDRPSFALVHFMEPHLDYDPPAGLHGEIAATDGAVSPPVTATKVARLSDGDSGRPSAAEQQAISRIYDEEIRAVDAAIGDLASAVSARPRPSWLWVTSDHGEELWDHGSFEHGHHLHGELVRAPLVVVGPGIEPARVTVPVEHVDVYRTLLGIAGAPPPQGTRGTDLLRVANDPALVPQDRAILHEDCLYGPWRAALTSGRWRAVLELPSGETSLWRLDEHGQADRRVTDAGVERRHLPGLIERIYELRGTRALRRVQRGRRLQPVNEELEQLRSLGYVP